MKKPPPCLESWLHFLSHVAFLFIWGLLSGYCERYIMMAFHSRYKLQPFTVFSTSVYGEPALG